MTYRQRTALLRTLGYQNYTEYLLSPEWKEIRLIVLRRDGWACRLCGVKASEVHHRDYERDTLLGRRMDGLEAVCRECHRAIEFDGKRKRSLAEVDAMQRAQRPNGTRAARKREPGKARPCVLCNVPVVKRKKGFCLACCKKVPRAYRSKKLLAFVIAEERAGRGSRMDRGERGGPARMAWARKLAFGVAPSRGR